MVYLIHFRTRLHHAGHYLGSTRNLPVRIKQHLEGKGSPLLHAATRAGIAWTVVRTWPGGRALERRLKDRHNSPSLCPICELSRRFSGDNQ